MSAGGNDELAAGSEVGRYRVERLLGRGGMGAVYAAFDTGLHRKVALKIVGSVEGVGGRARFFREARAVAALEHPNVVAVFDVGEHGDSFYLAMELLDGRTLRDAAPSTSQRERVRWLCDAARALAAAHDIDLVHRDVKPDNVMVTRKGIVKVLDFGIARRVAVGASKGAGEAATAPITGEGMLVGTPMYMAPEQLRDEPLDARADQFSWGVTAYEVLAGVSPWGPTSSAFALVGLVLSGTPRSLAERCPELPAFVVSVVERAMRKDRNERFATMHAIVAELEASLGTMSDDGANARTMPALASSTVTPAKVTPAKIGSTAAFAPTQLHTPSPTKATRGAPIAWIAIAVASLAAIAFVFVRRPGARDATDATASTGSAASAPAASHGAPRVPCDPEARALYEQGVTEYRNRTGHRAVAAWKQAIAKDPSCGPAYLATVFTLFDTRWDLEAARDLTTRARDHRDHLDDAERAMVDALEPLLSAEPSVTAWFSRMQTVVEHHASDPRVQYLFAIAAELSHHDDLSRDALAKTIELAPAYPWAYVRLSGHAKDATAEAEVIDRCLAVTPAANYCHLTRIRIVRRGHDCAAYERAARARIAATPKEAAPYLDLAGALVVNGAPREALDEALRQFENRRDPALSSHVESSFEALYGDYAAVELELRAVHADSLRADEVRWRCMAVADLAALLDDTSRRTEADALVRTTLATMKGLSAPIPEFRSALAPFYARAFDAHLVTRDEVTRAIGPAPTDPLDALTVWPERHAMLARNEEEARDALALLPPDTAEPLRRTDPGHIEYWIAHAAALAGDWKRAEESASSAVRRCDLAEWAIEVPHAWLLLARAREKLGDVAGARAALDTIVGRWGSGKLRIKPAEEARELRRKLK